MPTKHQRVFALIFDKPDKKDIDWDDFINLCIYLGASVNQSGGSAHGIKLNGEYAVFHKPHPGHTIYPTDLKRIRRFLKAAGVEKVE